MSDYRAKQFAAKMRSFALPPIPQQPVVEKEAEKPTPPLKKVKQSAPSITVANGPVSFFPEHPFIIQDV
jgi:hypothetical protein